MEQQHQADTKALRDQLTAAKEAAVADTTSTLREEFQAKLAADIERTTAACNERHTRDLDSKVTAAVADALADAQVQHTSEVTALKVTHRNERRVEWACCALGGAFMRLLWLSGGDGFDHVSSRRTGAVCAATGGAAGH